MLHTSNPIIKHKAGLLDGKSVWADKNLAQI